MLKYTVKRLLQSLVTIFLIATAVFLMMRCLPTDYYFTEEQLMKFTDQQKTAALEAAGLTDPIPTQLIKFYNDLLHLDFGTSRRIQNLSLIHISEPTRRTPISYAVFCLKKKKQNTD